MPLRMEIITLILLFVLLTILVLASVIILLLYKRLSKESMLLKARLIRQKEMIQQLEQRSNNKSLAFASAGHDIRNSILIITGLIDLCRDDIPPHSQLDHNLIQMRGCASKLLDILKSFLDVSKVEAGKMLLEEVEFDIAQVLEESADLCHVVALKKGLEIIWDPCDFSVLRSSKVRGDCQRLKQILDNLLGNAVKFTAEGHVVLRVWCRKPNREEFKISSNQSFITNNKFGHLSRCFCKDTNDYVDTLHSIQHDPSVVEFIFEVDDTGLGIPKEKRTSVFENYIQVEEKNRGGHEGTGLGLGIVKSYVQMMGGKIGIMDKEPGQGGTCFRFNIFLKSSEANGAKEVKVPEVKMEGLQSLLLIQGDETKRIMHNWMESLGMKVWIVQHNDLLYSTFEEIKCTLNGYGSPYASKDLSICILVVIDVGCGDFTNLHKIFDKLLQDTPNIQYKMVWLANANTSSDELRRLNHEMSDIVLQKPIHGSRLFKILRHVQEGRGGGEGRLHTENKSPSQKLQQYHESSLSYHASSSRYDHEIPLKGFNILLVEDNSLLQRINSVKLIRAGATVKIAGNGLEALELTKKALQDAIQNCNQSIEDGRVDEYFPYHFILMDCEMPIMDGYEATRHIRTELNPYGIHVPIIAHTAHSAVEEEKKATLSGMDFSLTKGVNPYELSKAYNSFVRINNC